VSYLPQVFNYEGAEIRTIVKDGEVWFVAKDVCEFFGDTNYRRSVSRLEEDEKGVSPLNTPGGVQQMTVVNEAGLYSLLFHMQPQKKAHMSEEDYKERVQKLKNFKRWVTHVVLPSIRKHGAYMTDDVLERSIQDPDFMIGLLTALKEERQKRLEAENTVNILMHVNKTYTATEIAKELGFKSAQQLNKDLERRRIQYNQNGTWVLFSKYADKGYVEIKQEVLDNGKVIYHRRFTQRGREFLLKLYGIQDGEAIAQ
jgi:anti-repressor protein